MPSVGFSSRFRSPPGEDPSAEQMIRNLHRANEVALAARAQGRHPFGAILVDADHDTVLLEQGNVDTLQHAEIVLARRAVELYDPDALWRTTLYTTVEPCAMCAGAHYWANIGRLVYGISEHRLLMMTGNHSANPTLDLPCRRVFDRGQKDVRVWGPIGEAEDLIVASHLGFWV